MGRFAPVKRLGSYLAAGVFVAAGAGAPAPPQHGIKLLIPSNDTCAAFVRALNSGDAAGMLNLGGWALGYLSGVAVATDRNILGGRTSEGLMDRLALECQRQPQRSLSAIVQQIARDLLAGGPQ